MELAASRMMFVTNTSIMEIREDVQELLWGREADIDG
jgi:hypothetical protein